MTAPRYAIYVAPPPESRSWRLGCDLLGYDAATGEDVAGAPLAGLDAETWSALTAEPRRYGFHATLKAPFALAPGVGEADLLAAVEAFAAARPPAAAGPLALATLGPFFALVPEGRPAALHDLADATVVAFDAFRAPLTPQDRARRRPEQLTARQLAHLDRWGYPYVFEEFRYHMTLAGPVGEEIAPRVGAALAEAWRPLADEPHVVDALVIFTQAHPTARFRAAQRFPLRGRGPRGRRP